MRFLILILIFAMFIMAAKPHGDEFVQHVPTVAQQVLGLHTKQGPGKEHIVWYECGKKLSREKAEARAVEYSEAILSSIEYVYERKGVRIDPRHVNALLFRESSHNECVIGNRETMRLATQLGRTPSKGEIVDHVKLWKEAHDGGWKWCQANARREDCVQWCEANKKVTALKLNCAKWCKRNTVISTCVGKYIDREYPEYAGIKGWDIGVAQYHWPSRVLYRRVIQMPDGRVVTKISLSHLFDYDVAIQILVNDLYVYRSLCKNHKHYRWSKGRTRRLGLIPTEHAYYAHHHTGAANWSYKYWRAVGRHLRVIDSVRDSNEIIVALNPVSIVKLMRRWFRG